MKKTQAQYRRAFGHQVAVELPEDSPAMIGQAGDRPVIQAFTTCDGLRTHRADTGLDCSGQSDDIGGFPV